MKPWSFAALLLSVFATCVVAWSKEDHEIFQLNDAVRADLGLNTTFYSWIGITPSASQKELNRAYRKKASELHPDKARQRYVAAQTEKGKKPSQREINKYHAEAEKRFSRFSVVGNIMRGEGRARYDHFLKNGFPAWRGTGYYYSRYRPGTGTVLIGLFVILGGLGHYGALLLSHKRHRDFVDRYIKHARKMAWGDSIGIAGIPGLNGETETSAKATATATPEPDNEQVQTWNRKQRRFQEKESKKNGKNPKAAKTAREKGISTPVEAELTSGPVGAKKRVVAQNGKVLIVDSVGNVYIEEHTVEGDKIELLLDIEAIEKPTIYDTVLFRAPIWAYRKSAGRYINPVQAILDDEVAELEVDDEETALDEATSINANAEQKMRQKPRVRQR